MNEVERGKRAALTGDAGYHGNGERSREMPLIGILSPALSSRIRVREMYPFSRCVIYCYVCLCVHVVICRMYICTCT